ncbi:MAG: chemotaxis protein [Moraxellaceae bacterium]|nr:chemotaxis protein [Moraxellaceae bacterium]MCP5177903.1 chemotaxis protein [Moraxellaceae bacterium]
MPIPFIVGGVALAAAALGAKKGYDGYQDKNLADEIIANAQQRYKDEKGRLDKINEEVSPVLEDLGKLELKIGLDFEKFDLLVEEIQQNSNFQKYGSTKVKIPKHQLNKIKDVAISATDYMKTVVGGGVTGAATGFAVYGGVMALGAASTGTPIAALSGAAAYNATMAAIGGGSLAAGGWGMAGGAMVLGGAVLAPVLAVAGIAYAIHGSKALENARDVRYKVDDAVDKMHKARNQLSKMQDYAHRIQFALEDIYEVFQSYFETLKLINEIIKQGDEEKINGISAEANRIIENGIACAAIMADLISTPLFKVKKDDKDVVVLGSDGNPQIQTDQDGMQILDKEGVESALAKADGTFVEFKKAQSV